MQNNIHRGGKTPLLKISIMNSRQLHIIKKLGIDSEKSEEDILHDLINLSEWLYDELEKDEQTRFLKEIKRLVTKPTN